MPLTVQLILGGAGTLVLFVLIFAAFGNRDPSQSIGPAVVAVLPFLVALGLITIPFAPNLGDGRWVAVDVLAVALFVVGAFFGYLYGLPVTDPDALKATGTAAGTFLRPSSKLDKVIDNLLPALTGGLIAYGITQASHFNALFLRLAHLSPGSTSELLGIGLLLYFTPIGFMLSYSLTATVAALAFKQAEESLVFQSAIVTKFPPLPDLPVDPTPEQFVAAKTIADQPYASLREPQQKAAWARAQTILGNFSIALNAYQDAIILDGSNAALIVDYATTIYNAPHIDNVPAVLTELSRAEQIAGPQASPDLRKRMLSLRAAATLYVPGMYESVILLVNDWIDGPIATTRFARYYRACAFGQYYESLPPPAKPPENPRPPPAKPPENPRSVQLSNVDFVRLTTLVEADVAATIVMADKGREFVRMVIDPTSPLRTYPQDDDLQTLGADDLALCKQAGMMAVPPPSPPPHPIPPVRTLDSPPPASRIPYPPANPGDLVLWINAMCPP
ncbi:MAG: hypothetical protein NVS2B17_04160 [Candidatus Velthaea sp.]